MTLIQGNWLSDPAAQAVLSMLTGAGHQALVVGGCVRNALLECPVNDVDIATSARPDTVVELAKSAGIKSVPTGIAHGTVTLVKDGLPFEVTTFRRDVETDGRRAVVAFADTIDEDARRRDFTMNALYAQANGTLVDPLGGLPDCLARRVVFIEDAEARVREDYLRILRFFRFHAWYGDPLAGLDPDGLSATAKLADGLCNLSRERVTSEIVKLLSAPDPAPAIAAMAKTGVLARVLPGADAFALAPLVHLEAGLAPDAMRRLSVLGGFAGDRLRLSRAQSRALGNRTVAIADMAPLKPLAFLKGFDVARDVALARAAMFETPLAAGWQAEIKAASKAKFPVVATDLPPSLQGAAIGEALKKLQSLWIASDFHMTRGDLLIALDAEQGGG